MKKILIIGVLVLFAGWLFIRYVVGYSHVKEHLRDVFGSKLIPYEKDNSQAARERLPGHYDPTNMNYIPDDNINYEDSREFRGIYAVISRRASAGGGEGVIDTGGRIIIKPEYANVDMMYSKDGEIIVTRDSLQGIFDTAGKELCPPKYDKVSFFNEGMCIVTQNDKMGYVDSTGKEIVPPTYLMALNFIGGIACVCMHDEKWGCIDKTGKLIVPMLYVDGPEFKDGIATVRLTEKGASFKINTRGEKIN
jgi:hypothetical protein